MSASDDPIVCKQPTMSSRAVEANGQRKYGIVDLFAGIGGVADGFREQGNYEIIALVDNDQECRDTYLENYPDATYLGEDIRELGADRLRKVADGRQIDGIVGCPPCQGFSAAGTRDDNHPMNGLARDYFRLVRELRPLFVVMENVPNILANRMFQDLTAELAASGYRLWTGILNAALHGVPQTRQRAIMIGLRNDLGKTPGPPAPTHYGSRPVFDYASQSLVGLASERGIHALGLCPAVERIWREKLGEVPWLDGANTDLPSLLALPPVMTVGTALGDLPPPAIRGDEPAINGHVSWNHTPCMLERMRDVPPGGNLNGGRPGGRYFSQAYSRLHPNGLAFTISTFFHNPGSGRFLHYHDLRCLTVREAARLQTISDKDGSIDGFVFPKSITVSERLIGNAFPRRMAKALAESISTVLNPR